MKVGSIIVSGVLLGALVVVWSLDQPGGPVRAMSGVVVGAAFEAREGPSSLVATVALREGGNVQARVIAAAPVRAGQSVRLNEYRGALTGKKTYEVVAVEGGT